MDGPLKVRALRTDSPVYFRLWAAFFYKRCKANVTQHGQLSTVLKQKKQVRCGVRLVLPFSSTFPEQSPPATCPLCTLSSFPSLSFPLRGVLNTSSSLCRVASAFFWNLYSVAYINNSININWIHLVDGVIHSSIFLLIFSLVVLSITKTRILIKTSNYNCRTFHLTFKCYRFCLYILRLHCYTHIAILTCCILTTFGTTVVYYH